MSKMSKLTIVSFGYLHGPTPDADITIDLRKSLYDPHVTPGLVELTGLDKPVRDHVLGHPDCKKVILSLTQMCLHLAFFGDSTVVAVGCSGGRHRSVIIADEIGARLSQRYYLNAKVRHRDVLLPVVQR